MSTLLGGGDCGFVSITPVLKNPFPWLDPVYGGTAGSLGRKISGLNCRRGGPLGCGSTITRSVAGCGPSVTVWISELEEMLKCTASPALIVRVPGKNRNQDTFPASWPATTLFLLGWNLASCLAFLTAFAYSEPRARLSALADGIEADFGSTFTLPDIPGCTRQMYL